MQEKTMMEMRIDTKRYAFSTTLHSKLTFIQGDSAVGKSTLTRVIDNIEAQEQILCSDEFVVAHLTKAVFQNIISKVKYYYKRLGTTLPESTDNVSRTKRNKLLNKYWEDIVYREFFNSIIIIDDEDFIESDDFACFYNNDKENYYIIIGRNELHKLNYGIDDCYAFRKDNRMHWLEPLYHPDYTSSMKQDLCIVEGSGSDFKFFKSLLPNVICPTYKSFSSTGGKDKILNFFRKFKDDFKDKELLLVVDLCSFGSLYYKIFSWCGLNGITIKLPLHYESFEYLLLKSNYFKDTELESYLANNLLRYPSKEILYYKRVQELLSNTEVSYDKSEDKFYKCFIANCKCKYVSICEFRSARQPNKVIKALVDTIFEYFIKKTEDLKEMSLFEESCRLGHEHSVDFRSANDTK